MNITDYFPVGTKIVIEVVPGEDDCTDCIFYQKADCDNIKCNAFVRKDDNDILFKVVEVKEP